MGKVFLVLVTFSIFACGLVISMTVTRLVWAMSRDQRFPGYHLFSQVNQRTGTPLAATLLAGILIELVLAAFAGWGIVTNPSNAAGQTTTLFSLFSAATLLPAIIYLATVILYLFARGRLPETHGFSLGAFEWPVIILALLWLLFELSIFRDASFTTPWVYSLVMFALGLIYFLWMLVTRPKVLQAAPQVGELNTPRTTDTD